MIDVVVDVFGGRRDGAQVVADLVGFAGGQAGPVGERDWRMAAARRAMRRITVLLPAGGMRMGAAGGGSGRIPVVRYGGRSS